VYCNTTGPHTWTFTNRITNITYPRSVKNKEAWIEPNYIPFIGAYTCVGTFPNGSQFWGKSYIFAAGSSDNSFICYSIVSGPD